MRSIIAGLITAELDSSTLMKKKKKDVFLLFIVCAEFSLMSLCCFLSCLLHSFFLPSMKWKDFQA